MIEWYSPWAFVLIVPLIIVLVLYFYNRKEKRATLKFSNIDGVKIAHRGPRARLIETPTVLKGLALIFLIMAIARPQTATTKTKRNIEGIDIVICLDISDSMLIEDMLPENRLESSKKTISEFISNRVSDRIGVVAFSGEAYTRVPLTLDYPLLIDNVKKITTTRNIKMGTAIGVALASSVARLKESTAKSRIIIFMTDGENNSGTIDPQTALNIAKGYGIKIYSIGMGKDGQAQLPVYITDPLGNTIKQYRPIHSTINEELLKSFATETGGKFWRASSGKGLADVFHTINSLEKTKIEVSQFTKYNEEFRRYLILALIFYVLALILEHTWFRRLP